jgi:FMN phosphatase YigB (HAD superfamily)
LPAGAALAKPSSEFFARVVEEAGCSRESILYVGDRPDNDIAPAQRAGLATAWIRRGPWGYILEDATLEEACLFRLRDLSELPELVRLFNEKNGYEAIAESGLNRSSSSSR